MFLRIFFLILLFSILEKGLTQDSLVFKKKPRQSVEFSGNAFLNSNTINNDFIWAFYNGAFIDDILKEDATRKMVVNNRLGGETKIGFSYLISNESNNGGENSFSFSFFDRQYLDLKFSRDLFYILFYGNNNPSYSFAGNTAYMGDFQLNLLRYQQFRLGWEYKGDFFHGSYGLAVSLLSGEQNKHINAPIANLFTAGDGTYMDFDLAISVDQTDTARTKYFAQNGMGLSADFYYEMPYTFWNKHGRILFEIRDLGFISWNFNSMHYAVDSFYHYEGVDVADLFNLDSSSFQVNIDKVIDNNTAFRQGPYSTRIPCTFDIHTKSYYGKQVVFEKGIVWWFNTSARPYYYGKIHFLFGKNEAMDFAYVFGYGAYGRYNSGLEAKIRFAKHFSCHVMSNYLFSGITAQSTTGMGLYVKLVKEF